MLTLEAQIEGRRHGPICAVQIDFRPGYQHRRYVGVSRSHGDARPPKSISMKKQPMRRLLSEFEMRRGRKCMALANGARAESMACLEREQPTSRSRGTKYLPGIFQLMLLH
ncbi:hypothetical protein WKW80_16390 [Variovorax humicola]|uniref:Uncharacterized protein n=1 Tax=Variovorax humicola TaxID=1769758 RepID=A0ABU8W2X6_9BURK